jgi:HEPN domain-containing protein
MKTADEWIRQSKYDYDTARTLFNSRRYVYAVFFCHLAIEKALKGIWQERHDEMPPKTHNLTFLLNESVVPMPADFEDFVHGLAQASIPTRYPETLESLQKSFRRKDVVEILSRTKEVMRWVEKQLKKT